MNNNKSPAEFSFRAIVLGVILAVVFGAANAYVGLKVGMTVSASIPAAVISMAILRGVLRRGTVLENNIVQTIGSSGESLAAGVIFTIPAFIFLGYSPSILEMFIISALGGCLGIIFMIPLRRYLIVREHNTLPFPEGTACAKILMAGQAGGAKALTVFAGLLLGGLHKFLMLGLVLWKDVASFNIRLSKTPAVQTTFSAEVSPVLLGVGYIIGPRIAALMFSGAFLGWFVLIPLIQYFGNDLYSGSLKNELLPGILGCKSLLSLTADGSLAATSAISGLAPMDLWKSHIRYIGAGAVLLGGVVSLLKSIPIIVKTLHHSVADITGSARPNPVRPGHPGGDAVGQAAKPDTARTEHDISLKWVAGIALVIVLATFLYLTVYRCASPDGDKSAIGFKTTAAMGLVGMVLIMVFGSVFITVAARIVGIVGSSSSPVSGMTITTLIATALVIAGLGWTGINGMMLAMSIGAIVCIAVCMSGDISQDLKTGYLVGATPYKQQIAEFIGVLAPAIAIAWILMLLHKTYGLGGEQLKAPQATLMALIVKGVFGGQLPWLFIMLGVFIGIVVELLGISSLPFAIGLYLPLSLSTPIMIGGLSYGLVTFLSNSKKQEDAHEKGVLFSSGLVAGDALVGIIVALLASIGVAGKIALRKEIPDTLWENILGCLPFILLTVIIVLVARTRRDDKPAG